RVTDCYLYRPPLLSFPTRRSSHLGLSFPVAMGGSSDPALLDPLLDGAPGRCNNRARKSGEDANDEDLRVSAIAFRAQDAGLRAGDRKSTRLNSSHVKTSYAVFRLK